MTGSTEGGPGLRPLIGGITECAIFMLDPGGRVTTWNAGAERIKGYRAVDIIGRHFSCFYTEEDRSGGVPELALAAALRDGKHQTSGWRLKKDGTRFMASVLIEPLRDAAGQVVGFAKITRDVSEQARMAHDFNNLLHVVETGIQALRRLLPQDDARTGHLLDVLKRNLDGALVMTRQLLAYPMDNGRGTNGAGATGDLVGTRVLVVEDESLIAMHVEELLEQLGCEMLGVASSVRSALEMIATTDADLGLLDVNLGGERSYPVAEALQARGLPFVFMSGDRGVDERWRGHATIQKPFQLDQARSQMLRALRGA
jgi:PAS domain S-box-containing protein